jgi:hypothetical protein
VLDAGGKLLRRCFEPDDFAKSKCKRAIAQWRISQAVLGNKDVGNQSFDEPGEMTSYWPAPESTENMNTSKVGHLGLTEDEENALVSFMPRP